MLKAEESLRGNDKKNINKKISSLHPFGRFVGASSKLSGREHGLITLVPAQWELIFYNCEGLHIHILQNWHPCDVRTSGSVGT